jgi:hypothetical protein
MAQHITVDLDDEAAAHLARLAPSHEEQVRLINRLIREAPAPGTETETMRLQVLGLISEVQSIKSRLLSLETANE